MNLVRLAAENNLTERTLYCIVGISCIHPGKPHTSTPIKQAGKEVCSHSEGDNYSEARERLRTSSLANSDMPNVVAERWMIDTVHLLKFRGSQRSFTVVTHGFKMLALLGLLIAMPSASSQALVSIGDFFIDLGPSFSCDLSGREPRAIKAAAEACIGEYLPTCGIGDAFPFLGTVECFGTSGVRFSGASLFYRSGSSSASSAETMNCIMEAVESPGCLAAIQAQVRGIQEVSFGVPTLEPTQSPVVSTDAPTGIPTSSPSEAPTSSPTVIPTTFPTVSPTKSPTFPPTAQPVNFSPTFGPTKATTLPPVIPDAPTLSPTLVEPTASPIATETMAPTPKVASAVQLRGGSNNNGRDEIVLVASIAAGAAFIALAALLANRRNKRSGRGVVRDASLDEDELHAGQRGLSNKDSLGPKQATTTAAVGGAAAASSSSFLGRVMGGNRPGRDRDYDADDLRAIDSASLASLSLGTSASIGAAPSVESFEQDRHRENIGGAVKKDMIGSPLDVPSSKKVTSPRRKYDQVGLYCSSTMEDIEREGSVKSPLGSPIRTDTSDDEDVFSPDPSWDPDDSSVPDDSDSSEAFTEKKASQKNGSSKPRFDLKDAPPKTKERRSGTPTMFLG